MKYYKNYTAKKFKFPRRLLFVLICALVILVVTLILGNYLQNRLQQADIDTSDIPKITTEQTPDTEDSALAAVHDEALLGVSAGCLDLTGCADEAAVRQRVEEIRAGGYNAFAYIVTDENEMLTYASPAAGALARLPQSPSLVSPDFLTAAVTYGESLGLRSCAVMQASRELAHVDGAVAAELAAIGFDELLIRGFEDVVALDNEAVEKICGYVRQLRDSADMDFGICMSKELYTAPQNAPYIEKIYYETEFLAIDLSGATADDAAAVASGLQGSFSAYLMRAVLNGSNAEQSVAVQAALEKESVKSILYVSAPPRPQDDPDEPVDPDAQE